MKVFFHGDDYRLYKAILSERCAQYGVEIWAYSLLPNHVHLIAVPSQACSLSRALGEAHRRYAYRINRREGWSGHLWQERFFSFPMSEPHLQATARYVLLNPIRAGLVDRVEDWEHTSLQAHLRGQSDGLADPVPLSTRVADFRRFLARRESVRMTETLREHSRTGLPLGDDEFVSQIELEVGRPLRPVKPGPKAASEIRDSYVTP